MCVCVCVVQRFQQLAREGSPSQPAAAIQRLRETDTGTLGSTEAAGREPPRAHPDPHTAMGINFLILLSKQGKVRLNKWYQAVAEKEKQQIIRDITAIIPLRRAKMCNVIEYKDSKIVYKRYASLFFITSIANDDNELITLELIQRYVEIMDKAYGNVCELDIVFNFQLAYYILDELVIDGNIQESSSTEILRKLKTCDDIEEADLLAGASSRKYIM